jgi:hypothetical protein
MNDLDRKILNLKSQGKSLRQIGSDLHLSYEGVRKRLRNLVRESQVSTPKEKKRLTALTNENDGASTASNARKSRLGDELDVAVNQVSTKNAPPQTTTECGNPPGDSLERTTEPFKPSVERGSPRFEDLAGAIKGFLEANGIQVYSMQVTPECYQVEHNGQIIRFYVQRNKEME